VFYSHKNNLFIIPLQTLENFMPDSLSSDSQSSKVVLITGCSSGIGLTVALGLHQRGYRVIASARNKQDVQRLRELGLQCLPL
jgi:NADPH:quinone reductase-like Zn-dependent oxidoreductase